MKEAKHKAMHFFYIKEPAAAANRLTPLREGVGRVGRAGRTRRLQSSDGALAPS